MNNTPFAISIPSKTRKNQPTGGCIKPPTTNKFIGKGELL